MDAKFVQDGKSIDYTPVADVDAGDVVIQGTLVGIANQSIKAGDTGAIATEGVFSIVKAAGSGKSISAGAVVYWDATAGNATATATDNTRIGVAIAAAVEAATSVFVKLG